VELVGLGGGRLTGPTPLGLALGLHFHLLEVIDGITVTQCYTVK